MPQLIFSNDHSVIQYLGDMPYMGQTTLGERTVSFRATPNFGGETAGISVTLKDNDSKELAKMNVTITVGEDTSSRILEYASVLASGLLDAENLLPLAAE